MDQALDDKEKMRETFAKNFSNIYMKTGILTKDQVIQIIEDYLQYARKMSVDTDSELYKYRNEISNCIYRITCLVSKDKNKPISYLYLSSPVLYHLAFGKNPDGSDRVGLILRSEEEKELLEIPTIEDVENKFLNNKRKAIARRKRNRDDDDSEDEDDDELSEDDLKIIKQKYDIEMENYSYKQGTLDPIIPPLYLHDESEDTIFGVGVKLTEEQIVTASEILKQDAIESGNDPNEVNVQEFAFLMIKRSWAPNITYFRKENTKPNILITDIVDESITANMLHNLLDTFNTDENVPYSKKDRHGNVPNILGQEKFKEGDRYPLIHTQKITDKVRGKMVTGNKFTIEFSGRASSISDASFARQIYGKITLENPKDSSKSIDIRLFYAQDTSIDKTNTRGEEDRRLYHSSDRDERTYGKSHFATKNAWTNMPVLQSEDASNWERSKYEPKPDKSSSAENVWTKNPQPSEKVWRKMEPQSPPKPKPIEKKSWRKPLVEIVPKVEVFFPIEMLTMPLSSKQHREKYTDLVKVDHPQPKKFNEDDGFTKVKPKNRRTGTKTKPVEEITRPIQSKKRFLSLEDSDSE